jgi:hypothetical protein
LWDEEALIAADAADRAEAEDTEEPIPDRAMGVVEGFGVAGGTGLSVGKHWHLSAVMCPKFRFGGNCLSKASAIVFLVSAQNGNEDFPISCL